MRQVAIIFLLALCGCDSSTPPAVKTTLTTPDNSDIKPSLFSGYDTPPACQKAGGTWKSWCPPGNKTCVMPWPDGGKRCVDSSECASKTCMFELTARCELGKECSDPVRPQPGDAAVGICKREDVSCGSYIEIKRGIAQEAYHID
jgi:hypothetical protein